MDFIRSRLLILALVAGLDSAALAAEDAPHVPRMSYLDNGVLRLGVDLNLGGAITYLSPAGKDQNLVNSFDWGRQIQMSFYSGPVPFHAADQTPAVHWKHLGWNPVQSGDDFRNPARVLEHHNDGRTLTVKSIPMQWPLDNVPGECTFECRLWLKGATVHAECRLNNARTDETQYAARHQELPAVYVNGPYHRLLSYTGDQPFTRAALATIKKDPASKHPWASFRATESWAALVNDQNWGLGIWQPGSFQFTGGFNGTPGAGGPRDNATGYVSPLRREILDANIRYDYRYVLIVGTLDEIREHVYQHAARPTPPQYHFQTDRQGWHYHDATDTGWPIRDFLHVRLDEPHPQLLGPAAFWQAADAPVLTFEAAFQTSTPNTKLFWTTHAEPNFAEARSLTFPIQTDGQFHTYRVRLDDSPNYRGAITGLRLDPTPRGGAGQWIRVKRVALGQ